MAGLRQALANLLFQRVQVLAAQGRERNDGGKGGPLGQLLQLRQEDGLVLQQVHLVHHQQGRHSGLGHTLQNHIILVGPGGAVHHHHDDIDIAYGAAGGAIHVTDVGESGACAR